jgi:hypothetical protein
VLEVTLQLGSKVKILCKTFNSINTKRHPLIYQ